MHALAAIAVGACAFAKPASRGVVLTTPPGAARSELAALPATFKIATFNVHRRPGDSITRAIQGDPALRDADLIVLQEVPAVGPCGAACVAAGELGMYSAYEPDIVVGDGTVGQAILARVPITSVRVIEMPAYADRKAALVGTVKVDHQIVTIYVVHLTDEISIDERLRQIRPVLDDARTVPTPAIVAGDFNTSANFIAHVFPIATGSAVGRFEALVRDYGFATPVAGSGPTFRVWPKKLDGIYTRGFQTSAFGTAHGEDISDHLAVWAVMTLHSSYVVLRGPER
jgi:endonuclease/exonuclease/phosphatase family metal-dependent hydrolase